MNRVVVYLVRFAVIIAGYAVSSLAASAFLNVVTLASLGFTADEAPAAAMGSIVFSIPFIALFVAYFAFIPSVVAILISRNLRPARLALPRAGRCAWWRLWSSASSGARRRPVPRRLPIRVLRSASSEPACAAVSAIGSCAGRTAGSWRERPRDVYFACAVMIFSAKAENTPANR